MLPIAMGLFTAAVSIGRPESLAVVRGFHRSWRSGLLEQDQYRYGVMGLLPNPHRPIQVAFIFVGSVFVAFGLFMLAKAVLA
jgi:hypothetical protein